MILGISTAVPDGQLDQVRAAEIAQSRCAFSKEEGIWIEKRYRSTGVKQRATVFSMANSENNKGSYLEKSVSSESHRSKSVSFEAVSDFESFYPRAKGALDRGPTTEQRMSRYALEAPLLAQKAAQSVLENTKTASSSVTHLITVSCTGFVAPGIDISLIQDLGLQKTMGRTHIGFMGCHGAFNGLQVARAIVTSQPTAKVLIVCVELCSLHFHYGYHRDKIIANALFADGASAFLVGFQKDQNELWQLKDTHSFLFPESLDGITWQIGGHGFEMTLQPEVPILIRKHLHSWLQPWLQKHDLTIDQIRSWALHPGGPKILNAVEKALNLSEERTSISRAILSEHGNMSSATIGFILQRMIQQNSSRPCIALGFGPGVVGEAALLT